MPGYHFRPRLMRSTNLDCQA